MRTGPDGGRPLGGHGPGQVGQVVVPEDVGTKRGVGLGREQVVRGGQQVGLVHPRPVVETGGWWGPGRKRGAGPSVPPGDGNVVRRRRRDANGASPAYRRASVSLAS